MFLKLLKPTQFITKQLCRRYSKRVYTVSPTCNVNVIMPYKIVLKPLDPLTHPDNDKVLIHFPEEQHAILCNQICDSINIINESKDLKNNLICEIEAPIKANLNVTTLGDINVEKFSGEALRLFSEKGNITIGKSQNQFITARANEGNITTDGDIEADKVMIKTIKGNISTNKLKCLGLQLESDSGEINTTSSYCEESYFVSKSGKLNLQNVHKNSKIFITENGALNMVGFDGTLDLVMVNGQANIQISRIEHNSNITIKEEGTLELALSDEIVQNYEIVIFSKKCTLADGIEYSEDEEKNVVTIKPKTENANVVKLVVDAPKATVDIKLSSWMEMIQKNMETKMQQAN